MNHSTPTQADLFDSTSEPEHRLMQVHLRSLLTDVFREERPVPRLLQITALVPPECRRAWQLVAHTLLARRLSGSTAERSMSPGRLGRASTELDVPWDQPILAQRWERLIREMTPPQCFALVTQARNRGLMH